MENQLINIEIAYAQAHEQTLLALSLCAGTTVAEAIEQSGLLAQHPEIDLSLHQVGIFGQVCSLAQVLEAGDRIEIYRPLQQDPKQARRQRASKR